MLDYLFIVNPVSGKGRGRKIIPFLKDTAEKRSVKFKVIETEYRSHATEISSNYKNKARNIISVGGDGTLNEVLNGVSDIDSFNLGVLPVGSGNDFVKNLSSPKNIRDVLSYLIDPGKQFVTKADVGIIEFTENDSESWKTRRFLNNLGIGFDAQVGFINQSNKTFGGIVSYIFAVIKALFSYEMIEFDSISLNRASGGKKLMISIGNGRCSGGGFYLNPNAKINDGILDISLFDSITRRRLLSALPLALLDKLEKVPEAKMETAEYLELELKNPYYAHCDGEIISQKLRKARISLLKNHINLLEYSGS